MRVLYLAVCATALQAPTRRRQTRTRLQIAPSGVDGLPGAAPGRCFFRLCGRHRGGAVACNAALDTLRSATQKTGAGAEAWRKFVEIAFLGLGLLYVAAGVGHFAAADAFRAITPPFGTWGLWPVPTAPAFHVAWTGQAELVGGATLVAGGAAALAGVEFEAPVKFIPPAACGSVAPDHRGDAGEHLHVHARRDDGHAAAAPGVPLRPRFAVQCVLLGLLATLAKDAFFYAWGARIRQCYCEDPLERRWLAAR